MGFKREERYIVFKLTDLGNSLKGDEIRQLAREYAEQRRLKGKKPLNCLVVESDWPEFEPTWGAIAARVAGAQPAPSFADAYQGAMEEVAIWKKRALEAEDLNRKFVAEINGPMLMGEPVAQPAPKAVAYLDLGVGGYTDIGTDLTDEELATLPKGRHMLGVIGTYGVDGYVSAQPAPSVPDDVVRDAKRYRLIRRGQHWSVVDGIGDHLRADALDSAVDRALAAAAPKSKP